MEAASGADRWGGSERVRSRPTGLDTSTVLAFSLVCFLYFAKDSLDSDDVVGAGSRVVDPAFVRLAFTSLQRCPRSPGSRSTPFLDYRLSPRFLFPIRVIRHNSCLLSNGVLAVSAFSS